MSVSLFSRCLTLSISSLPFNRHLLDSQFFITFGELLRLKTVSQMRLSEEMLLEILDRSPYLEVVHEEQKVFPSTVNFFSSFEYLNLNDTFIIPVSRFTI